MKNKLIVNGDLIKLININREKYISLTDMAKKFGESNVLISSWMRRKDTIEFLAVWEKLHNSNFKPHEFVGLRNEAGTNRFNLSAQKWVQKTNAIGIISKTGKTIGGIYATEDIAMYFGQWLSPEFSLYVIKEFKRLKKLEVQRSSKDWQLNRALSKINYRIHTDAIDKYLIPPDVSNKLKWPWFTEEAEILNLAMFGMTSVEWKKENPNSDGNVRDYSTQEQLLVLANLEVLNSSFVKDGLNKQERLIKLNLIAQEQMTALLTNPSFKKLTNIEK